MTTRTTAHGLGAGAVMAGAVALATAVAAAAAEPAAPCCFSNDRLQGTCTVIPRGDETCRSILEYLNNPMSSGKSYCENTSIRGGWVLVDCATGTPTAPPKPDDTPPGATSAPPAEAPPAAR
ncbi:MAG TPA: hypothetical protein P5234_07855 [Thermoanaerobaculaceae bacterium]|nr:hypothetical protein [Thermoanaerobaculaceae bacterium]HRS16152.1 hypothetical protein [Thermoanaerobaculaceae bacterium]